MALTQIDQVAALIAIDMQKGIVTFRPSILPPPSSIASHSSRAPFVTGLPVVLVNVAGLAPGRTDSAFNFSPPPDWTDLVPELDRQPSDYTVTKLQIGAFYGTALEQILRRRSVTPGLPGGNSTSSGVEATARTPTITATMS